MIEPGQPCVTMIGSALLVFGADVDEMNVEPVDLGDEIRQGVDLRLAFAPIVLVRPILRELLHRRELHALRCVRDLFALRPFGCRDAIAQVDEVGLRGLEMKRTNSGVVGHGLFLLRR